MEKIHWISIWQTIARTCLILAGVFSAAVLALSSNQYVGDTSENFLRAAVVFGGIAVLISAIIRKRVRHQER